MKYRSDPVNLGNKPFTPERVRLQLQIGPFQPGKDGANQLPPIGLS